MALRVYDLIFFGRPMLLIPVWTIYLHFLATTRIDSTPSSWPPTGSIVDLLGLTLIFIGVYVLNQIYDLETDRRNNKLYFLACGLIPLSTAWAYYAGATLAGLLLCLLISPHAAILGAALVALGIFYSGPGVKLKDRPVSGLLANSVAYGMLVPVMVFHSDLFLNRPIETIPYFLAVAAGYILTTIPDMDGDAASGKRTVAVVLGPRASLYLAALTAVAASATAYFLGNVELAGVALVTLILIIYILAASRLTLVTLACKLPILLLTILAVVHFPIYLLLLLLTIILTRFYYKKRFGLTYPRLG